MDVYLFTSKCCRTHKKIKNFNLTNNQLEIVEKVVDVAKKKVSTFDNFKMTKLWASYQLTSLLKDTTQPT
jgi:hypothetical protein